MLGEGGETLANLEAVITAMELEGDQDLSRLRVAIDRLEVVFSSSAHHSRVRGDHFVAGSATAPTWIARTCHMSVTSAADRLCVGAELDRLPAVKAAVVSGEIGYQSAALLCHLRDQLGEKRDLFDEREMLGLARTQSVASLRFLCRYARHVADPDGFFRDSEEAYDDRRLRISMMADGMHSVEGVLGPEGGAALKSALDKLAARLSPDDDRSHRQRMADALVEMAYHAMDEGRLGRVNGTRPHVSVTTTLEGLMNRPGAPAADLAMSAPVSTRTAERLACDGTITRIVRSGSVVVDVGRAARVVSPSTRRALKVRDGGCRWPGCERPVSWTHAHHIEFWTRGGPTNLGNLVLLCFHHHRLVHEGGWQIVRSAGRLQFLPPERELVRWARAPGSRWAA